MARRRRAGTLGLGLLGALWLSLAVACDPQIDLAQDDFGFDGTCVNCHSGLSAGQVHESYKLRCIDCHGGDDQVAVPENAFEDAAVYRDPVLIGQAHVRPKAGLARFFWANGIDDDGDGMVDEGPTFDDPDNPTQVLDFGEIAEPNLHGEGIGAFIDAEYNRDLAYTRWLNPGDLRVATTTCGSASSGAFASGTGCHQRVVDSMRRSIMVNMGAVINGAYYGNESWRTTFQETRDMAGPVDDPRQGVFGYVLDYDSVDACIDTSAIDAADGGRGQPSYDIACLALSAAQNDDNAITDAPGNAGLPAFEIAQGSIGPAPDVEDGMTLAHTGVNSPRISWGGRALMEPEAPLPVMHAVPNEPFELVPSLPDPVDMILRGFRAYYPLNYPGSSFNFNFTFGESIKPGVDTFKTFNPYGRGHSTGCTSCHMIYNYEGNRSPQTVVEYRDDGTFAEEQVADPTTKHREFFGATQDIVTIEGQQRLVGVAVTSAERDTLAEAGVPREQQRYYSDKHELTTRITTDQCGLCHGFVTRINFALQGMAEDEQRDPLARDQTIAFTTPAGTQVRILSSWVREDNGTLVLPDGLPVIEAAKQRNAELEALGLIPGGGGCAANVFTEDCNNNGELDTQLTLQRLDIDGNVVAETTINEDQNGNGALDLIDHAPRQLSVDGRQMRYVYGGANGATRLMDIHFERGMHCIDCHMIQDSHGDGNIYHTNWEAIEIECEDCHGLDSKASLVTSGPNGGNDLRAAIDHDGLPFLEERGERIIQRSRVTPGLFWYVPQLVDIANPENEDFNARSSLSHSSLHLPAQAAAGEHNAGSTFAGAPGESELTSGKLECYTCHTSWIHNCMGCHVNVNFSDAVVSAVDTDGLISAVTGENETWFNNSNQPGRTNFQLLEFMRSPFILGYNPSADGHRLAPFRSSMQVHLSASDDTGNILLDNITFTTYQDNDANTGKANAATSGAALNHTLPHTVRPRETKSCEQCHSLVDRDGAIRNEHILAQTYGLGTGRYPYVGDWAMIAGTGGIELYDYKEEGQFGGIPRFPGIIVDSTDRTLANVEPQFAATDEAVDMVHIRNFTVRPQGPDGSRPTLRDLAVTAVNQVGAGKVVISDISQRGHSVVAARPALTDEANVFVLDLPDTAFALAHLAPDISEPFVYVANGPAGLTVVEILDAPTAGQSTAQVASTVAIPGALSATEIALAGGIAYVGTAQGTIEVFDISAASSPTHVTSVPASTGQVNGLAVAGFTMYAATADGLAIFDISDLRAPGLPTGASASLAVTGIDAREVFYAEGHTYVAAGAAGVLDIDVTTPARPGQPVTILDTAGGQPVVAEDMVITKVPGQAWLLVVDASGDLIGQKFDNSQSTRERCLPDTSACGLDMDWRDPTIMGRDPDPTGEALFRQSATILQAGRRLARPALWEKIGFHDGRRYRDSFMPGSGVLSRQVMTRMYNVQVCEDESSSDRNGNGLGDVNLANGAFFGGGPCPPLSPDAGARGEQFQDAAQEGGLSPLSRPLANALDAAIDSLVDRAMNPARGYLSRANELGSADGR